MKLYPRHTGHPVKGRAYTELESAKDVRMLPSVQQFQGVDLYSKGDGEPNVRELGHYYTNLILNKH